MANPNYPESVVKELEAQSTWTYAEAKAFAEAKGLKIRSVIPKIASLGLTYVPKPKVVKPEAEPVIRKAVFVARVEAATGVKFPSMEKMTKTDLEALANWVEMTE